MLKKTVSSVWFLFLLADLILVNGLLIADSARGFHTVVERIGIDPVVFWILSLSAIVGIRLFWKIPFSSIFYKSYLYILVPSASVLAIGTTYFELTHYYNYLYSHYFIYFERITLWAISTWTLVLVLAPGRVWQKYWQHILFGIPIGLLVALSLVWTWPQDVFLQLVKEDNLIETTQVIVLLVGSVVAFLLVKRFFNKRLLGLALLFMVGSVGLFFIAGDEISWGQRLLGFSTPVELAKENTQDETTLHNINGIHQLIGYGYILIGLYGAFAWIMADNFLKKSHNWTQYFVPPVYLFFFFYLSLIYNAYALRGVNNFREWSEVAELLLYSGISGFLIIIFLKQDSKSF